MTNTELSFDNARAGLRELNGSVWERDLVDLLARHGEEEGALLAAYERLVGDGMPPAVRYLSELILADERRHHRVLVEMANAVAWEWSRLSPQPAVPELPPAKAVDGELVATLDDLLRLERRDQADLRKLRKEIRPMADTTLWGLLVDLQLLDTDKHLRILGFLRDHLDER